MEVSDLQVLGCKGVIPVFDGVLRSFIFQQMRNLGPFFTKIFYYLHQKHILIEAPAAFELVRIEMGVPVLPALLGSSEIILTRRHVEPPGDLAPLPPVAVLTVVWSYYFSEEVLFLF